uniref:Putative ovule protein n=1 Tax=Solanum chacoense TaxID=4108 RepID=A0A0V0H2H0_SOLCH
MSSLSCKYIMFCLISFLTYFFCLSNFSSDPPWPTFHNFLRGHLYICSSHARSISVSLSDLVHHRRHSQLVSNFIVPNHISPCVCPHINLNILIYVIIIF